MIACLDAAYGPDRSAVACILAHSWEADAPFAETTHIAAPAAPYQPGEFYRRELPLLMRAVEALAPTLSAIVIDGYVWLDAAGRPGLGARLFEALEGACPIVGIGKTEFDGAAGWAQCVTRGAGASPLFVTAAGLEAGLAADAVRRMHGAARLPTLVRHADRCARAALAPPA